MSERQNIRALLVEDDQEDAAIFRRYADRLGDYEVSLVRAATVQEAREDFDGEQFDLIFIDLRLEGAGSGIDLLKGLGADDLNAPAVVVTGSGNENKAVEAMKAGAYDYLVKDALDTDLLERTIRNVRHRYMLEQERKRMMQELEELSITDELTGLANRRHLDKRLAEETRRSERTNEIFSVLMIDLDHFKKVNDKHGHQAGDEVLQQCAETLEQTIRATDFVARFGGEEFCVLLPDTSHPGGQHAGERARKAIARLPEPVPTISVGVAYWEPHASADELIARADEALYKAKETGRDRVVVYGKTELQKTG